MIGYISSCAAWRDSSCPPAERRSGLERRSRCGGQSPGPERKKSAQKLRNQLKRVNRTVGELSDHVWTGPGLLTNNPTRRREARAPLTLTGQKRPRRLASTRFPACAIKTWFIGTPCAIRTCDPRIRNPAEALIPSHLRQDSAGKSALFGMGYVLRQPHGWACWTLRGHLHN